MDQQEEQKLTEEQVKEALSEMKRMVIQFKVDGMAGIYSVSLLVPSIEKGVLKFNEMISKKDYIACIKVAMTKKEKPVAKMLNFDRFTGIEIVNMAIQENKPEEKKEESN